MAGFEFLEELPRGPRSPFPGILQSLSDALLHLGSRRNVEQALIGRRILHYRRSFALYREHHWTLAVLQGLHKVPRSTPERRQGLNIFANIKHGFLASTFLGAYRIHLAGRDENRI
jgi:hypothetical protein